MNSLRDSKDFFFNELETDAAESKGSFTAHALMRNYRTNNDHTKREETISGDFKDNLLIQIVVKKLLENS